MDALQGTGYSAGQAIGPLRRATSRSLRCSHPRPQSAGTGVRSQHQPGTVAGHGSAERAETQIEDGVNVCGREQLVSLLRDRHEDYRRRLAGALQRRAVA